jgi:hypothetical protein
MRGGERIARISKRVLFSALLIPFAAGFLELSSRLLHAGKAPLLPYYFAAGGAAFLPSGMDLRASFYGLPPNRYITDDWGARIADPALAGQRPGHGLFVLGDSQMLGYMLDFEDTFASRVAQSWGDRRMARILASPTNHPEIYRAALRRYAPHGLERQRLAVVGLNLGNDLDEMYSEALNWSRFPTPASERWLFTHSFTYMDWALFKSHALEPGDEPLGVNRILYMLKPDERIILAREAVRTLDEVIRETPADLVLVLIVPSDIQVDPKQFLKYRRYYHSQAEFDRWNANAGEFSSMMNVLESYLAGQIERHGHRVLRVSQLVAGNTAEPLFDRTSHHLTARSHQIVADAILAETRGRL